MLKRYWVIIVVTFVVCLGVPNWVYGQSSDLVISQGPIGPAQVIRSQIDTVQVTIKNAGTDTIRTAFDIRVYLSLDAVVNAGDRTVGNEALAPPIAPNDSVTVNVPVEVSALLALGAYQWLAQVDVSGLVGEGDETNNLGV
ncbi:MAG: hypothetical protein HN521_11360, partial [Candidatus Latescibacteria bacterium]|nr:hypothetical protein [Candidatus Latescibacterota bacterium]